MALYDYDLKCIEERHIKDILSRLFELNPIEKVSKLMKSLSDFHYVTFNFLRPKVTDTGTVVTLGSFSVSSGKEISLLLETIEGRTIKDYYFLYRLFKLQLKQVCLKNDDVTYGVCDVNVLHISSLFRLYILFMSEIYRNRDNREIS